jgi:hypothetical protein
MAKRRKTLDAHMQLRPEDLVFTEVSRPDLDPRGLWSFAGNLTAGDEFWSTAKPLVAPAPCEQTGCITPALARANLRSYADNLMSSGISRDASDRLLAAVADRKMTNFDPWTELTTSASFVHTVSHRESKSR